MKTEGMRGLLCIWLGGLMILGFYACEKEDDAGDMVELPPDRSIRVTVRHIYSVSPLADSLVPEADVRLFDERQFWLEDILPEAVRTTDSLGEAVFDFRKKDYYYLRATHPVLGNVSDSVSTPPNTVSLVELRYF